MDRPYRIYERLLAEMQQDANKKKGNYRNRNRSKDVARGQKEIAAKKVESGNEKHNLNFPDKFVSKRKLKIFARERDIPRVTLNEFIEKGLLKSFRFPRYRYGKYHLKQLQYLIENYNQLY